MTLKVRNKNKYYICALFEPKKCQLGIKYGAFYALVLMLLTKFDSNSTFRRCSFCFNLFNRDAKFNIM